MRLRPDHKLAVVRKMGVTERVKLARDVLGNLNWITGQVRAA